MRPEEADMLAQWVRELGLARGSVCLNLGSSTKAFREQAQPHIAQRFIRPLERDGIRFVHCDMKQAEGVDEIGDILDPGFRSRLRSYGASLLVCSNLLEHLTEPQRFASACGDLVNEGSYALFSVPRSYPYHPDPIDTLLRAYAAATGSDDAGMDSRPLGRNRSGKLLAGPARKRCRLLSPGSSDRAGRHALLPAEQVARERQPARLAHSELSRQHGPAAQARRGCVTDCPACGSSIAVRIIQRIVHCRACGHRWMRTSEAEQQQIEQSVYTDGYAGYEAILFSNRQFDRCLIRRLRRVSPGKHGSSMWAAVPAISSSRQRSGASGAWDRRFRRRGAIVPREMPRSVRRRFPDRGFRHEI